MLKRLVRDAQAAGPDESAIEGEGGFSASIERSAVGPGRLVRVFRDGAEVYRTFSLQAGEARPPFYPDDVPYVSAGSCILTWAAGSGLSVVWMLPPSDAWTASLERGLGVLEDDDAFPQEVLDDFRRRLESASEADGLRIAADLRARLPRSLLDRLDETLGGLFAPAASPDGHAVVEEVIAFHEARGWRRSSGPDDAADPRRTVLHRKDRTREIRDASMAGLVTLALSEPRPGHA